MSINLEKELKTFKVSVTFTGEVRAYNEDLATEQFWIVIQDQRFDSEDWKVDEV